MPCVAKLRPKKFTCESMECGKDSLRAGVDCLHWVWRDDGMFRPASGDDENAADPDRASSFPGSSSNPASSSEAALESEAGRNETDWRKSLCLRTKLQTLLCL